MAKSSYLIIRISASAPSPPEIGGNDVISSGADQDIVMGGFGNDVLRGDQDRDIILGDNGVADYAYTGDDRVDADTDLSTLDYVATTDPLWGGQDTIEGGTGDDTVFGGGQSDVIFGDGSLDTGDSNWTLIDIADFNQDGRAETFWRNTTTGQLAVQFRNDAGQVYTHSLNQPLFGLNWTPAGLGDLNGDGHADLIWRDQTGLTVAWLLNGLSLIDGGQITNLLGNDWQLAGVSDLNGDSKADLVWRNLNSGQTVAWLMDGFSPLSSSEVTPSVGLEWQLSGLGDLSGDGKPDLLWQLVSTGDITVWFMDGQTPISSSPLSLSPGIVWQLAGVGDLNGDGKADLLWRNTFSNQTSQWFMDGVNLIGGGILAADPINSETDHDLLLGDQGSVYSALPIEENYFSTFSDQASAGAADTIYGNSGNDKILGQQGADTIDGGSGEDDIIGGHKCP
jgi:Ca2+-binding RTX toxin-like protein